MDSASAPLPSLEEKTLSLLPMPVHLTHVPTPVPVPVQTPSTPLSSSIGTPLSTPGNLQTSLLTPIPSPMSVPPMVTTPTTPFNSHKLFASKEELQEAVTFYCLYNNLSQKVARSCKTRLQLQCPAHKEGCSFSINGRVQKDGMWKITQFNINHTCSNEGSKRQRGINTDMLARILPKHYFQQPATPETRHSNEPKHLQQTTKRTHGLDLTYAQARKIAIKMRVDCAEQERASVAQLEDYFKALQTADAMGTYIIQIENEQSPNGEMPKRRFNKMYVAWGTTKSFQSATRRVIELQSVPLTTMFGGYLFLATAKDAQDQSITIAYQIAPFDTEEHWLSFIEMVHIDFPNTSVFFVSNERAINALEALKLAFRISAAQIAEDLKNSKITNAAQVAPQVPKIASCTTEAEYRNLLKKLHLSEDLITWFDQRKRTFVSSYFLDQNISCYGQISIPSSEDIANLFSALLKLPLVPLCQMLTETIAKQFAEGKKFAIELPPRDGVTEAALNRANEVYKESEFYSAVLRDLSPGEAIAGVTTNQSVPAYQVHLKQVAHEAPTITCTCRKHTDTGILCPPVMAVFREIKERHRDDIGKYWDHLDPKWYSKVFHFSAYIGQYGSLPLVVCLDAEELQETDLLPWPKPQKLIPKEARPKETPESSPQGDEKKRKIYKCASCGKSSHNSRTCEEVNTEYIHESTTKVKRARTKKSEEVLQVPLLPLDVDLDKAKDDVHVSQEQ